MTVAKVDRSLRLSFTRYPVFACYSRNGQSESRNAGFNQSAHHTRTPASSPPGACHGVEEEESNSINLKRQAQLVGDIIKAAAGDLPASTAKILKRLNYS